MTRITSVFTGPHDLPGERRFVRWFAMMFCQDIDLIYASPSFEVVLNGALDAFRDDDLVQLNAEIAQLLERVGGSGTDEQAKLDTHWYPLGAAWWPEGILFEDGLKEAAVAIARRIAAQS